MDAENKQVILCKTAFKMGVEKKTGTLQEYLKN